MARARVARKSSLSSAEERLSLIYNSKDRKRDTHSRAPAFDFLLFLTRGTSFPLDEREREEIFEYVADRGVSRLRQANP